MLQCVRRTAVLQRSCLTVGNMYYSLPFGAPKPFSKVVPSNQSRSGEITTRHRKRKATGSVAETWTSFKELFPKHKPGVGTIKLQEGEAMFLKMYSKDEHDLKAKQHLFLWHYLALGMFGCIIVTADLFLFDIITVVALITSVGFYNRILHKRNTPHVLEVVMLPDKKVRIRTLTALGTSRTKVLPVENCNFGDLENFAKIDGKEYRMEFSKTMLFIDESDLDDYDLKEKALRHQKYISPFLDIDRIQTSKDLFARKRYSHHVSEQEHYTKISDGPGESEEDLESESKIS